jgi:hypothetical protein
MRHYTTYSSYLKNRFGAPVARVPVNAGFSCPNRDGTKSSAGCSFCDNRAFSPVAATALTPVDQLTASIARLKKRFTVFIAYLQPFSNTYGSVSRLQEIYEPLLQVSGVKGLCVGTRPDCIEPASYDYLGDLAGRTYLSVELGLQSSHDATLERINRGHSYADFADTVARLSIHGIETVAHVILGLPGETDAMMFETASRIAALPVSGVKIHQLMIIKNTPMEKMYRTGEAGALSLTDYAPLLCGFLARLRPDQHIHRLMSDSTGANGLIAPLWSADKNGSLAYLREYMEEHGVVQGSGCRALS